jgi:hypothetical protein
MKPQQKYSFPEDVEDSGREAKFNAGLAKLQRMDIIKRTAFNARVSGNFILWQHCLFGIRNECNERMTKEEKSDCDTFETQIIHLVNCYIIFYKTEPKKRRGMKEPESPYHKFHKYEQKLGEIEYKYKLSMPDTKGFGEAVFA